MRLLPFAALVLAALVDTNAAGQDLIGVVWAGEVCQIDSHAMTATTIGTGLGGQNALAVDGTGTIWSTALTSPVPGNCLTSINPVTGAATVGYSTPDIRGLAGNGTSTLWAIVYTGYGQMNHLARIDTSNGNVTTIATLPFSAIQALTFHRGVLYGWDIQQGLIVIDPVTGQAATVFPGRRTGGVDGQWLFSHPDGRLLVGRDLMFQIDLATGATTQVASFGRDLRGVELLGDWSMVGQGCADVAGPSSLYLTGTTRVGQPVTATSINHATGTIGVMIFGLSTTTYAGQTLPLLLDPILGTSGCSLYTSIDASVLGTTPAFAPANLVSAFVLPPGSAGMQFHVQHAAFAPVPGFTSWSNAVTIRVH
jgi:hypothetical protein